MDFKTIKGVKKIFIIITFLILAAGFMLVISPFMSQNTKHGNDLAQAQSEQANVKGNLDKLKGYKDTIKDVEALDAKSAEQFPSAADTPGLVASVTEAASKAGISTKNIEKLTTGIPTLVASSATLTGAAAAPAAEGAAPAAEAAPAASTDAAAAPAPGAAGGTSNLAEMTVDLSVKGSVSQITNFLNNLTAGDKRNLLISGYSVSTDAATGEATLSLNGTTYIYKAIPTVDEAKAQNVAPATTTDGAAPAPTTPAAGS